MSRDLAFRASLIAELRSDIAMLRRRHDGLTMTHMWDAEARSWRSITAATQSNKKDRGGAACNTGLYEQDRSNGDCPMLIPKFTCRYPATFIPKHGRKPRTKYFRAKNSPLWIEKVEPEQVTPAFRLLESTVWKLKVVREIIRYGDTLYWPMTFQFDDLDCVTEGELLTELQTGARDIFRQQKWSREEPNGSRTSIEDVAIQSMIDHGYERTLPDCQSKAQYLLICGGVAYVAAGYPLLSLTEDGFLYILSTGPDRAGRPDRKWVTHGIADTNRYEVRAGKVFRGTEMKEARKAQPAARREPLPEIDVLDAGLPPFSMIEVRIDCSYYAKPPSLDRRRR
jgi:hypothetical protein